jgi:HSP20 family protein
MQERMSRMFGDVMTVPRGRTPMWHPDIDVDETADGWVIEARLPGVAPDEVSVEITDRELVIRSRHEQAEGDGVGGDDSAAKATARTRRWSSFLYRLTIPSDVDPSRIDATMDHGLLTITLPRSTESRSRSISVGTRGGQAIEGEAAGQPTAAGEAAGGEAASGASGEAASGASGEAQQAAAAPTSTQGGESVAGTDYTSAAGVSQGADETETRE